MIDTRRNDAPPSQQPSEGGGGDVDEEEEEEEEEPQSETNSSERWSSVDKSRAAAGWDGLPERHIVFDLDANTVRSISPDSKAHPGLFYTQDEIERFHVSA